MSVAVKGHSTRDKIELLPDNNIKMSSINTLQQKVIELQNKVFFLEREKDVLLRELEKEPEHPHKDNLKNLVQKTIHELADMSTIRSETEKDRLLSNALFSPDLRGYVSGKVKNGTP